MRTNWTHGLKAQFAKFKSVQKPVRERRVKLEVRRLEDREVPAMLLPQGFIPSGGISGNGWDTAL